MSEHVVAPTVRKGLFKNVAPTVRKGLVVFHLGELMDQRQTYHLTWHTYGTWLPGSDAGWVQRDGNGIQERNEALWRYSASLLKTAPVLLTNSQRILVRKVILEVSAFRNWFVHALNPQPTHVHVVLDTDRDGDTTMKQFKSWCSRRLNERQRRSDPWWVRGGSTPRVETEEHLARSIHYVKEGQPHPDPDEDESKD